MSDFRIRIDVNPKRELLTRFGPLGPDFVAAVERTLPAAPDRDFKAEAAAIVEAAACGAPHSVFDVAGGGEWFDNCGSRRKADRDKAARWVAKSLSDGAEADRAAAVAAQAETLVNSALASRDFWLEVGVDKSRRQARFVPGAVLGSPWDRSFSPADVMVVVKAPCGDAVRGEFAGPIAGPMVKYWDAALAAAGVFEASREWRATSLVRFPNPVPGSTKVSAAWVKDCLPLLRAEIAAVAPRFILSLGSDAASKLLDEKVPVGESRGRVFDYEYVDKDGEPRTAKLMVCVDPAACLVDSLNADQLNEGVAAFSRLVAGDSPVTPLVFARRHVNLYTEDALAKVVDEIIARPDGDVVALDAEWAGEHYDYDPNADAETYLRTIQFSARAGEGFVVVLRDENGKRVFDGGREAALRQLKRLLADSPGRTVRVGGHGFRADLKWLRRFGLDLDKQFGPAADPESTKTTGGFDTLYMIHSVFEAEKSYKLEAWASRLLRIHRYDLPLNDWVDQHKKDCKRAGVAMRGYAKVPDALLIGDSSVGRDNYAACDVDATRGLFDVLNGVGDARGLLDCDAFGLNSRGAWWRSHLASLAFLEMEDRGVLVDRGRVDKLVDAFMDARDNGLSAFQDSINWDGFNPESVDQVRELLFGENRNGKRGSDGKPIKLRPEGATSLFLEPVMTTGDNPLMWDDLDHHDEREEDHRASVSKSVLTILGRDSETVRRLADLKILGRLLINPLAPPARIDADGCRVYEKGMMALVGGDGKVRTRYSPVATGRCSSSSPNLQNWSNRREPDYKRLLGDGYPFPTRSVFRASPGCAIVSADVKSAELVLSARLSCDEALTDMVSRSLLDEADPRYSDFHALRAVEAFHLDCPPTKEGLKTIGKEALRVAAKNQVYGTMYGRGVKALCYQCREEGVFVSEDEMRRIVDGYDAAFPNAAGYMRRAAARAGKERWIVNPFGRYRRVGPTDDKGLLGSYERMFKNFNFQSGVADYISTWMWELWKFRRDLRGSRDVGDLKAFYFLLQIHDELGFEVPVQNLEWFVDEVLPDTVSRVKIPVVDPDGWPVSGAEPFSLDLDWDVTLHWSEPISPEVGAAAGVPPRFWDAA